MTQLRVFADSEGKLHVEISHPGLAHAVRLSVPILSASDPILEGVNSAFLVSARFNEEEFKVPFASISTQALWRNEVKEIGILDESISRDVLNNLVDILAYE